MRGLAPFSAQLVRFYFRLNTNQEITSIRPWVRYSDGQAFLSATLESQTFSSTVLA